MIGIPRHSNKISDKDAKIVNVIEETTRSNDILRCSDCGSPLVMFTFLTLICKNCSMCHTIHPDSISKVVH